MSSAAPSPLFLWLAALAWALTLVQALPALSAYDWALAAVACAGLGACAAWARAWRHWRAAVIGSALVYFAVYGLRLFQFEIEPLLAVISWPQALVDVFYVVWSSAAHQLSHGAFVGAAADLFRQWLMPLVQAAIVMRALAA